MKISRIAKALGSISDEISREAVEEIEAKSDNEPAQKPRLIRSEAPRKAPFIIAAASLCAAAAIALPIYFSALENRNIVNSDAGESDSAEYNSSDSSTTSDLTFDYSATISKYSGSDEAVIIPETIDGKKVVGINENAFLNCKTIKSVVFPQDVTVIGKSAFGYCKSLESITLHENIKFIMENAFIGCTKLAKAELPKDAKIGDYAFMGCSSLTEVTGDIVYIGESAFCDCTSLKSFDFPEFMSEIKQFTFYGCTSLENVTIPEGIVQIGNCALNKCTSLQEIVLPKSLCVIDTRAFGECSSLKSIVIPEGVRKIGGDAFCSCTSLENVTIPDSVTEIGTDIFDGCTNIRATYKGKTYSYAERLDLYRAIDSNYQDLPAHL